HPKVGRRVHKVPPPTVIFSPAAFLIGDFLRTLRNSTSPPCSAGGVLPATRTSRLHRSYTRSSFFASLEMMTLLIDCTASWGEAPGALREATTRIGAAMFNLASLVVRAGAAAYALRNKCRAVTQCIMRLRKRAWTGPSARTGLHRSKGEKGPKCRTSVR